MKIRGASNNNNQNDIYNIADLKNSIDYMRDIFSDVMLVNPVEHRIINVNEYGLEDSKKQCTSICPLCNDTCGCICRDTVSTKDNKCRFTYNKTSAYFVISKYIKLKYRAYILVMIIKLDTSFMFGATTDTAAIESITRLSSNLVIDPLTKIFNRKYLMDNVDYMMKEARQDNKCLCLACIDIDNFKRFNDTYGHEFGDKVLVSVAQNMVNITSVIKDAYCIRIGGDEFVIIGIDVDKNRFKAIMNNLCIAVDNTKLIYNNSEKVSIKISIGVSEMVSDKLESYKELYEKADEQLYIAKEAGKGCVR